MLKEFHVINRGYVRADHSMVMGHRFDGQFLIQSQLEPYGIELVFSNILSMTVRDPGEILSGSGGIGKSSHFRTTTVSLNLDGLEIVSERLFYRLRSDWLGRKAFLTHEVPSVDSFPAKPLEGNWRQCTNCADAWEERRHIQFSLCPGCGNLTEVGSEV
jgi:hypothetical protein